MCGTVMKKCTINLILFLGVMSILPQGGKSRLENVQVTRTYVEGVYFNSEGEGIKFKSESNGGEFNSFALTSINGRNVLNISSFGHSVLYLSIVDRDYIATNIQVRASRSSKAHLQQLYMVPKFWKKMILNALRKKVSPLYLTSFLHSGGSGIGKTSTKDFQQLLQKEEVRLLQEAALELGRRGLSGQDSAALMSLYVLALRFTSIVPPRHRDGGCDPVETKMAPQKNTDVVHPRRDDQCLNVLDSMGTGVHHSFCKSCPVGTKCSGLCGTECKCWDMMCGDCCYHTGCVDFHSCCSGDNINFNCFNIFEFKCDSPSSC